MKSGGEGVALLQNRIQRFGATLVSPAMQPDEKQVFTAPPLFFFAYLQTLLVERDPFFSSSFFNVYRV